MRPHEISMLSAMERRHQASDALFERLAGAATGLRYRLEFLADERVVKTPESLARCYADMNSAVRLIQEGLAEAAEEAHDHGVTLEFALKSIIALRAKADRVLHNELIVD